LGIEVERAEPISLGGLGGNALGAGGAAAA
jgi:hypothetical protein